jgi:hypothetical protein
MQVVTSPFPVHSVSHEPLHCVVQLPEQLNLPGSTLQLAVQSPEQLPVQLAEADPVQLAEMLAVHATGVQLVVQPPEVSSLHERFVAPEKSMFAHAARGLASAVPGANATKAAPREPRKANRWRWLMRILS